MTEERAREPRKEDAIDGVTLVLATPEQTHEFGRRLGSRLQAGDVVILVGALGAGKTALTKGVAEGMGISATVTSPTFVIARWHRPTAGGPQLIHVDAYRLGGPAELDDLDLEVESSVTVVEWGDGRAEQLSDARLRIELDRHTDDTRTATLTATGRLTALLDQL